MRVTTLCAAAFACLLVGAAADAADHPLGGDVLKLRDPGAANLRYGRFVARMEPALTLTDPTIAGATVEFTGSVPGDGASGSITLPSGMWTPLGNPPGSVGYRFLDPDATNGIKKVVYKTTPNGGLLRIIARGSNWPYQVTQPQGLVTVRFDVGMEAYCGQFSVFSQNQPGKAIARNAAPPPDCNVPVCGNSILEGIEECDDNNNMDGDDCSATCQWENTNARCINATAVAGTAIDSQLVASGLDQPVHVTAPPLDPNRLFIVEQPGTIRVVRSGTLLGTPFLNIDSKVSCCGERGLLSLAFHPNYEVNKRFFVNYTNNSGDTVIARYEASSNPDLADPGSEKILLTIDQPFSNHNGGQGAFGPDGYLYVGMGDGGGGGDPLETAQDDTEILGKLLRLDVDVESLPYYAVPPSNPNAGAGMPLGLIWAKGLRNPWRFGFDRASGDLYIGDVGQGAIEEIDYQPAASTGGENYGWDIFEGSACYEPDPAPMCPMPPTGFTFPVREYAHGPDCSVTGGHVYRGCVLTDLDGFYFNSDYCSADVRRFRVVGGVAQDDADVTTDLNDGGGPSVDAVVSFGEDARGEIYIADLGGQVFKIVPE